MIADWVEQARALGRHKTSSPKRWHGHTRASSRSTRSSNGHGGRLVLNLLLIRLGYSPAII